MQLTVLQKLRERAGAVGAAAGAPASVIRPPVLTPRRPAPAAHGKAA